MLGEEPDEVVQHERDGRPRDVLAVSACGRALLGRGDDLGDAHALREARLVDGRREADEVREAGAKDGRGPSARRDREEEVLAAQREDEEVGEVGGARACRKGERVGARGRGDVDREGDRLASAGEDEARGWRDGEPGRREGRGAGLDDEGPWCDGRADVDDLELARDGLVVPDLVKVDRRARRELDVWELVAVVLLDCEHVGESAKAEG